ncbi:unnamed protein product [Timema podura]|uniref:G-protein coupled receptors family 1 profile domain-containing protein n=1 Tax=Timema podura TaxID=61482 RepID=A0ABN7NIN8_TIMPD|nr:unnamed protein product [Timema podura]
MCFININITNRNGTLEDNALVSQTFWVALDILLLIVIVSGNTLTMCAMHKCRRLYSLISNKFVASLAVSDLLVGLTIPYHTAFYLNDTLCKNKTLCLSRFVLIVLGCCASICNLISIALDRYIAILYPFHYCRLMTQRMVSGMIVGGWITAIIIATIPTYWNDWDIAIMCEIDEVLTDNYILMVLTPSFLSVWVALLIVYWRIWREASEHAKRIRCPHGYGELLRMLVTIHCYLLCPCTWFENRRIITCLQDSIFIGDGKLMYESHHLRMEEFRFQRTIHPTCVLPTTPPKHSTIPHFSEDNGKQ